MSYAQTSVPASNALEAGNGGVAAVRVRLLGGFLVERAESALPDSAWQQRRSAKALIKLLATHPRHALHREQILEILWPDVRTESSLNSFAKALHAARRALEPELRPRDSSAYLHLRDDVLSLDTKHVLVDADLFQQLAESALQRGHPSFETALAAYPGELLPEDRYKDWSEERRSHLAELYIRLQLKRADSLHQRGESSLAVDHLHAALQQDPVREEAHRRLMLIYASTGMRYKAVRQFQLCQDALKRELDMRPDAKTTALFRSILAEDSQRSASSRVDGRQRVLARRSPPAGRR